MTSTASSPSSSWTEAAPVPAPTPADPPQPSRLAWPSRRTVCLLLLLLAAALAANFWVGILRNTFDDPSARVGAPQHDFYQSNRS